MRVVTLAAVVCLFGLALVSTAQTSVGTISGTVKDSGGAPIPGANVRIIKDDAGTQTSVTDAKGSFTFARASAPRSGRSRAEARRYVHVSLIAETPLAALRPPG